MFYVLWWGGIVITCLYTVLRGVPFLSRIFFMPNIHSLLVQLYDVPHNFSVMCFTQSNVVCSTVHTISTWCSQPTNLKQMQKYLVCLKRKLVLGGYVDVSSSVPKDALVHPCLHTPYSLHAQRMQMRTRNGC